jgi:threonine synthase
MKMPLVKCFSAAVKVFTVIHESFFTEIVCLECGHGLPPDRMAVQCPACGSGWLDARYDYAAVKSRWEPGLKGRDRSLWRYSELLPIAAPDDEITMGEGYTSLTRLHTYERLYNHPHLYAKDERQGPTSSFKDRQAALSVMAMKAAGITECVLASTGNAGAAYAAYCARAGIKLWLFLTSMVPAEKMREAALYGAEVVKVSGTYDETKHVAAEFAKRKGILLDRGARAIPGKESMKTMAFEIAEQLGGKLRSDGGWQAPDWYIQAVSGGIGPLGVAKGFEELHRMGLIDTLPKLGIVQAAGCAPMVQAFEAGADRAEPVVPRTLITVLATGDPGFSYKLLRQYVVANGGAMVAIEDGETFDAMRRLASKAGFSVEPATAVAFAGLERMLAEGTIQPGESVVVNCSGHTFTAESHILGDQYVHDLQLQAAAHPGEGLDAAIRVLDEQVTTILVVDDNPRDRRLIRRLLQRYKRYRILEASNGIEALQLVRDHMPDLIISDLTMPEMDGFSLVEQLKTNPLTAQIPVVVASAKALTEQDTRLLDRYNAPVWEKGSINTRELVDQVIEALGHQNTPGPSDGNGLNTAPLKLRTEQHVRVPMTKVVLIEDDPTQSRLARRLLESNGGFQIIEAATGRAGLKAVHEYHPDLVILDLMLPEMDGFEILRALKTDAHLRDIPVVVVSAKELTISERRELEANTASILEKGSLNHKEFLYIIQDALK